VSYHQGEAGCGSLQYACQTAFDARFTPRDQGKRYNRVDVAEHEKIAQAAPIRRQAFPMQVDHNI
jgi:hypothetical protein